MEPPAKRQKVSEEAFASPTRTLDLTAFQRPLTRRRTQAKVILPRVPDVTVTAGILDVAINDGPAATQIAVPTVSVELSLGDLGTIILPELTTSKTTSHSSSTSHFSTITAGNSTGITTTEKTVTVTETSTFRVSYRNGTFIAPTATLTSLSFTDSLSDDTTTTDSDSQSTSYDFGTTSTPATITDSSNNGAIGYGPTDTSALPSSTGNSDGGQPTGPVLTPQQTQMVGGIVGGVAGISLVLIAILYFLRWYRERLKRLGRLPQQISSTHNSKDYSGAGLVQSAAPFSHNSKGFMYSSSMSLKKLRPASDITTFTTTTVTSGTESEKGFSRLSGRKIAPVLTSGGDQYGGSYGIFEKEIEPSVRSPASLKRTDFSEGSFYRDSHGVYYGTGRPSSRSEPGTPMYPSVFVEKSPSRRPSLANTETKAFAAHEFDNALIRNMAKADGVAVFRGSPARTPVTQSPTTSGLRVPVHAPVTMDADIPEMPLPSPGLGHDLMRPRNFSRISARSTSSGKFKEELH